jgi:hypothetical protein
MHYVVVLCFFNHAKQFIRFLAVPHWPPMHVQANCGGSMRDLRDLPAAR